VLLEFSCGGGFQAGADGVCVCVCVCARFVTLMGRAEEIANDLNSQEAASVIWAQAKLGRKPGEALLDVMEGRAQSLVSDSSRGVANILWTASFLLVSFPDVVGRLTRALSGLRPAVAAECAENEVRGQTRVAGAEVLASQGGVDQQLQRMFAPSSVRGVVALGPMPPQMHPNRFGPNVEISPFKGSGVHGHVWNDM